MHVMITPYTKAENGQSSDTVAGNITGPAFIWKGICMALLAQLTKKVNA